ncbi:MAG: hypothetical protein JXR96_21555 [Deltaproteobacteria bacterium]|nr:hypothetical protein [Deltaproteobacteria bacterium]
MRKITVILSCLALVAACGGGFQDMDDPEGSCRLIGQALTPDGEPVDGIWAYLVRDGQAVDRVRTNARGEFEMELDALGPVDVVLNDAAGRGSLKQMALYEGDNDAGRLFLQPLESLAPVVDMRGVGFEERITTERGDYLHPQYNSDRSAVYAARRLGGEANYEVVRIDLPSGAETVLRSDEDLYWNGPSFTLIEDRVLYYQSYRPVPDEPDTIAQSHVLVDTSSGAELYSAPWWQVIDLPWVHGDAIYFFEAFERTKAYDTIFGWAYYYNVRPVRQDLVTGDRTAGRTIPTNWISYFSLLVHSGSTAAFSPRHDCDPEDPQCDWDPPSAVYSTDFETLTTRYVTNLGQVASWTTDESWNGDALYFISADAYSYVSQTIERLDVASGDIETVAQLDCGSTGCPGWTALDVSPDGGELLAFLYRYEDSQRSEALGFHRIDTGSGLVTQIPSAHTADGRAFVLCQGEYPNCDAAYAADGSTVVLTEVLEIEGERFGARVEIPAPGPALARIYAVGEGDYYVPAVYSSPDSSREALRLRDLDSGFFQLLVGEAGESSEAMLRQTHITADHSTVSYSADGAFLYYFTRDPISGYVQLFRVSAFGLGEEEAR